MLDASLRPTQGVLANLLWSACRRGALPRGTPSSASLSRPSVVGGGRGSARCTGRGSGCRRAVVGRGVVVGGLLELLHAARGDM